MKIKSDEISSFVQSVIAGVEEGLPEGYAISTTVKFQIGVKSKTDKEGNLSLSIVGIGASGRANRSSEEVAHIEFEVDDVLTVISKKVDDWQESPTAKGILEEMAKRLIQFRQPQQP